MFPYREDCILSHHKGLLDLSDLYPFSLWRRSISLHNAIRN